MELKDYKNSPDILFRRLACQKLRDIFQEPDYLWRKFFALCQSETFQMEAGAYDENKFLGYLRAPYYSMWNMIIRIRNTIQSAQQFFKEFNNDELLIYFFSEDYYWKNLSHQDLLMIFMNSNKRLFIDMFLKTNRIFSHIEFLDVLESKGPLNEPYKQLAHPAILEQILADADIYTLLKDKMLNIFRQCDPSTFVTLFIKYNYFPHDSEFLKKLI